MGVLGLGHDVVDTAAFGGQLAEPGSRMRRLFSVREVRQAAARARMKNDGEAVHLAAKWAGKEAFLKAWCEASGEGEYPFTLDDFPWASIEILDDSRGVPHVSLTGEAAGAFRSSMMSAIAAAGGAVGGAFGGPGSGAFGGPGGGAVRSGFPGDFAASAGSAMSGRPSASSGAPMGADPASGPYAVMRAAAASSAAAARRLESGPSPSPSPVRIHLSLSHDGPVASAVVIIDAA